MLMVNDGKITKVVPKLEVKSEGAQPKRIKIVFPGSRKRTSLSVDPNHGGKAAKVVVENSSRAVSIFAGAQFMMYFHILLVYIVFSRSKRNHLMKGGK